MSFRKPSSRYMQETSVARRVEKLAACFSPSRTPVSAARPSTRCVPKALRSKYLSLEPNNYETIPTCEQRASASSSPQVGKS